MSFKTFTNDFKHKHILIFGLGVLGGGKGVVEVFQQFDCTIRITDLKTAEQLDTVLNQISDKNVEQKVLGEHRKEDIEWADIIIKNPAVSMVSEYMQYARKLKKHITTEAAIFLKYTDSKTIGITGTRGKTTTTMATYHILKNALKQSVLIGGNIRDQASLPLLLTETSKTITVLELSSFALEGCAVEQVSPQVSAITNLYPDHMNMYRNMKEYALAKAMLLTFQNSSDVAFLNKSDKWTPFFTDHTKSEIRYVSPHPQLIKTPPLLHGQHNIMNLSFAVAIAEEIGVETNIALKFAREFTGAPFRQQLVGKNATTSFINDSTSTTPEAVIVALEAYPTATFIIGGTTKHLNLKKLAQNINAFQGELVFLKGSGTSELMEKLDHSYRVHDSLESAFNSALATKPSHIVFSPGFTSFELFQNEFDRAERFNTLVLKQVKK